MIQIINPQTPQPFPNWEQTSFADYYLGVAQCMDKFTKTAYGKEIMGHTEVQNEYDKINNIHYLALYLMFIKEDMDMDVENGVVQPLEYYIEKYKLDCIRKAIQCTGCSVEVVLGTLNTLMNADLTYCGTIQELLNYFTCN